MKHIKLIGSLLIVAAVVLAACAPGGAAKGTIKIATQSPLSGGQSVLGVDIKNGAELGLEQMGGALRDQGFTLELVPFDDQANPDTGVANAKNIVADPDIMCMVGHLNSGVMIPSMEEYHNADLAAVSPANTNPTITEKGYTDINRIVGRDDVQGVVGAEYANSLGIKSVYIMHDKTAYGQGVAQFFRERAEQLGMVVSGFEGTEEKANFDPFINPILSANPEMVFFGGIYDQAGVFFKQARDKGYQGIFMGPDGMDSSTLAELAGDALVTGGGMVYSTVAGPANVYPGTAKFIQDFAAKYGANPQPFSAQAFDSMGICLKGIEKAVADNGGNKPTRDQVSAAIRATSGYNGITGNLSFNGNGDLQSAKYFVIRVLSSDPGKWGDNAIEQTLDIAPPQ